MGWPRGHFPRLPAVHPRGHLIGQNGNRIFKNGKPILGQFTGHHTNAKACYMWLAGDVRNITIIPKNIHQIDCHDGSYTKCSKGPLSKTPEEMARVLKERKNGIDDLANCR